MNHNSIDTRIVSKVQPCMAYFGAQFTSGPSAGSGFYMIFGASVTPRGVRITSGNRIVKRRDLRIDPESVVSFLETISKKDLVSLIQAILSIKGASRENFNLDSFRL